MINSPRSTRSAGFRQGDLAPVSGRNGKTDAPRREVFGLGHRNAENPLAEVRQQEVGDLFGGEPQHGFHRGVVVDVGFGIGGLAAAFFPGNFEEKQALVGEIGVKRGF